MQTVLVTGASRGIGLALVRELLELDYRVVAGVRDPAKASELAALGQDRDRLVIVALDVDSPGSVAAAVTRVSEVCGVIDVLVNNAGVFPEEGYEAFEELDPDLFAEAFKTNVVGVARVCRGFLPLVRKAARPRIVNVSSGAGSISGKDDSHYYCYSVSKAALNMLTRALANELRAGGITVVALSPGWVRTGMGGPDAPLSAEESARSIARAVGRLDLGVTGRFLNRDGEEGDDYRW